MILEWREMMLQCTPSEPNEEQKKKLKQNGRHSGGQFSCFTGYKLLTVDMQRVLQVQRLITILE